MQREGEAYLLFSGVSDRGFKAASKPYMYKLTPSKTKIVLISPGEVGTLASQDDNNS